MIPINITSVNGCGEKCHECGQRSATLYQIIVGTNTLTLCPECKVRLANVMAKEAKNYEGY